jgi:hypothetical protein
VYEYSFDVGVAEGAARPVPRPLVRPSIVSRRLRVDRCVAVVNLQGRSLLVAGPGDLDVSGLAAGVYFAVSGSARAPFVVQR